MAHQIMQHIFRNLEFTFLIYEVSVVLLTPFICTDEINNKENSIRDARTPRPGKIVFNTMRYRSSETVHRLGYFQSPNNA